MWLDMSVDIVRNYLQRILDFNSQIKSYALYAGSETLLALWFYYSDFYGFMRSNEEFCIYFYPPYYAGRGFMVVI